MRRIRVLLMSVMAMFSIVAVAQDEILRSAEEMPQFPGGEAALMKCISQNFIYSDDECWSGHIVVQCVITETGNIGDIKVVRSITPALDTAAINAVRKLPAFTPARQNGKNVAVWYTIPINVRFRSPSEPESLKPIEPPKSKKQIIKEDYANGILEFIDSLGIHHIEEMPKFPKGEAALMHHIMTRLQYPTMARESMIEGKVMVQFIVSDTGEVGEPKVVKSAHPLLDAEALRVCRTLPKFIPGKRDGKPIEATFTVPVIFKLRQPKLEDFH